MNIMSMLPRVGRVLDTLKDATQDQKEAFMYHLQCLMAMLGACVSAKLIVDVPDEYHDEYLRQISDKIVKDTEWYMYAVCPLGYVPEAEKKELLRALEEDVKTTKRNAQGDPKTFSDWHTVTC